MLDLIDVLLLSLMAFLVVSLIALIRSGDPETRQTDALSLETDSVASAPKHGSQEQRDSTQGAVLDPSPRSSLSGEDSKPDDRGTESRRSVEQGKSTDVLTGKAFVIDGDSLKIRGTELRLFGIDAPELNHPYGRKAKSKLIQLCRGQQITARVDHIDHYGRSVSRCFLPNGQDLSAEMVRCGLAIDWPKYSGGCYSHLEVPNARRKMWLAHARQHGRMWHWDEYEARQNKRFKPAYA